MTVAVLAPFELSVVYLTTDAMPSASSCFQLFRPYDCLTRSLRSSPITDAMGQAQQLSSSFYQSAIDGSSLMQKRHDDDSKACLTDASWLVAGMIPGINREPLKKLAADPEVLLRLLYRWRDEAIKAGKEITRIAVAYPATTQRSRRVPGPGSLAYDFAQVVR
jgi:hypothetical protein